MSKRKKRCKDIQGMIKVLHKEIIVFKDFEFENGILGLEGTRCLFEYC
jgi:hypothetical protein